MIGKLIGLIDSVFDDKLIINVSGVGYLVFVSSKTADELKKTDKEKAISLIIETSVKEDAIELYGFISEIEKSWFLELTKVQGVGNKMGQKILSYLSIQEIANALITSDVKTFTKISGIGPKLASRITTELKDSAKKIGVGNDIIFNVNSNLTTDNFKLDNIGVDAVSALENLGYKKFDCLRVIDAIREKNSAITLENLITSSLRELSKNKI
jgi:Holliday junction DNA helicase RuvA